MSAIRVLVVGAAGRMGRQVVSAICEQKDMALVAAVDRTRLGEDAGQVAGLAPASVPIGESLREAIARAAPEVAVDFTLPDAVMANVRTAVGAGVAAVVGTSGLTEADLAGLRSLCEQTGTPAIVAPNFAIGAVLMMQFAGQAARYFDSAEIIELHHADKRDAPSATSRRTARLMAGAPNSRLAGRGPAQMPAARGEAEAGIPIHSVRLPGLVAHQEVIFGGLGETLSIRHDSLSRESFMPGVLLAIRKVGSVRGLVVGLENIL